MNGDWCSASPTPVFFLSAHSKGVAGENRVTAHSTGLKVAAFSMIWEWLLSAHSKGVTCSICILIGILTGTAHSKGVRRTTWRASMVRRAPSFPTGSESANAQSCGQAEEACRFYEIIIAYWYSMSMITLSGLDTEG